MNKHIIVFTTADSQEEASKLSRGLVEEKLAYCVNTVPSIQSTYFWEGKLSVDEEVLLQCRRSSSVEAWRVVITITGRRLGRLMVLILPKFFMLEGIT